ncbi:MAG: MMPL family transporter, partial [bacterium]|nr:MMPL family transporter [bacterium]
LTVGSLNILTITLGGILIGLGIDFPTYLLNRYYQHRESGKEVMKSLALTWATTGRTVAFGGLTTSAAFLLMMGANFKAFQELGLTAGLGILITLAAVLVLLPAFLVWGDGKGTGKEIRQYPRVLRHFPLFHPKTSLILCLILFIGFGFFLTRFRWQPMNQEVHRSLSEMNSPSVQAFQRFSKMLEVSLLPVPLMVEQTDLQKALEQNEELAKALQKYQSEGLVAAYESLSRILPSEKRQDALQIKLKDYPALNAEEFYRVYTTSLPENKFRGLLGHQNYRKFVTELLQDPQKLNIKNVRDGDLKMLLDKYLDQSEESYTIKTYVYLPPEQDYFTAQERFFQALEQEPISQRGQVIHSVRDKIYRQIFPKIVKDLEWLGIGVFLVVFTLVWIYFRSLKQSLISLLPMALGLVAAIGSYTLLVGPFSLSNFLWFPIYLGLAVDDVIHLGSHFHEPMGSLENTLQRTGGAIVFTSLATMLGFGSMALVDYPIVQQAGLFICLAMFWDLVASLVFLPA